MAGMTTWMFRKRRSSCVFLQDPAARTPDPVRRRMAGGVRRLTRQPLR